MIGEEEKIALLVDELEDIRCDNFDVDTDEDKTLKEAIKLIKASKQDLKAVKVLKMRDATPEERESIDKYIKSISKPIVANFWDLEQQPCGDMVSRGVFEQVMWERDVAIKQLKELGYGLGEKPKMGRWIAQDIYNCHTDFKCSECGYIHSFMHLYGKPTADYTYCPKCGAKMEESEEEHG